MSSRTINPKSVIDRAEGLALEAAEMVTARRMDCDDFMKTVRNAFRAAEYARLHLAGTGERKGTRYDELDSALFMLTEAEKTMQRIKQ